MVMERSRKIQLVVVIGGLAALLAVMVLPNLLASYDGTCPLTVRGRVVSESGEGPVPGADVVVFYPAYTERETEETKGRAVTGSSGGFEVDCTIGWHADPSGLRVFSSPSRFTLAEFAVRIEKEGYRPRRVDVPEENATLKASGELSGEVDLGVVILEKSDTGISR